MLSVALHSLAAAPHCSCTELCPAPMHSYDVLCSTNASLCHLWLCAAPTHSHAILPSTNASLCCLWLCAAWLQPHTPVYSTELCPAPMHSCHILPSTAASPHRLWPHCSPTAQFLPPRGPRRPTRTVQPQVLEAAVGEIILHDGHQRRHLAEEQHLVVGGAQLGQDAVQQLEFAGGAVQIQPGGHSAQPWGAGSLVGAANERRPGC